jgi:hypothetical protein
MITKADALLSLCPNAEWIVRGEIIDWKDTVEVQPTESEIEAKIAELQAAEPVRLLREKRNQLLAQSDWMANSDVTMSEEWRVYRQALRDLPANSTPELDENGQLTNITWPEKPQ